MPIRWRKDEAGIYESDSGRFRIELDDSVGAWFIFDARGLGPDTPFAYTRRLRDAKLKVDNIIDQEATQ